MAPLLSPLRYPGSKRRLAKYIAAVLRTNKLCPSLFIEPFAGGASVSLQLLADDAVEEIGLIEKDPLVAAFWQVVFSESDAEWLVRQVQEIEVTLEQWVAFKGSLPETRRERALVCLFLNRTSFSGILAPSSGPLGGHTQTSDYPIDCRFPRQTLVKRIRQAHALRDRVAFVWQADWQAGLTRIRQKQEGGSLPADTLFYFDPPFFRKADKLYSHYFTDDDHEALRDYILALRDNWVLSYDYCERVDELYRDVPPTHVEMLYSAAQNGGQRAVKEVILTNLHHLPSNTKLWQAAHTPK